MPRALSVYLDLLRFAAALLVFIVHANYDRITGGLPILWRISGLGNDAVMVFFVLSGFVIAYVSEARERTAPIYFAARFARLWSVAIPALVLTVILDHLGMMLSPALYEGRWFEGSYPVFRTVVNLFFLNEIWFFSIRPFSNGPYWSIGYEFWYYAIFAATFFLKGRLRIIALILLFAFVGPKILLLFPVWWAGVWAYRTKLANRMSTEVAFTVFVATALCYPILRLTGAVEFLDSIVERTFGEAFATEKLKWSRFFLSSYCIGILIALNFVAARVLLVRMPDAAEPYGRGITYLAGFTFSLYLFHYPLLQFFAAVAEFFAITDLRRVLVVGGSLVVVWIIGSWAERQKNPLKRFLARYFQRLDGSKGDGARHPNMGP